MRRDSPVYGRKTIMVLYLSLRLGRPRDVQDDTVRTNSGSFGTGLQYNKIVFLKLTGQCEVTLTCFYCFRKLIEEKSLKKQQ